MWYFIPRTRRKYRNYADLWTSKILVLLWGGQYLWHTPFPRLGGESKARASLWERRILNPSSRDRDGSSIFMDTSWFCYCRATVGSPAPVLSKLAKLVIHDALDETHKVIANACE